MKYIYFLLLLTIGYAQEKQRYQIVHADTKTFLIDSDAGRTWMLSTIIKKDSSFSHYEWSPIKFDNTFIDEQHKLDYAPTSAPVAVKQRK